MWDSEMEADHVNSEEPPSSDSGTNYLCDCSQLTSPVYLNLLTLQHEVARPGEI